MKPDTDLIDPELQALKDRVAKNIRRIRKEQGIAQEKLALLANVDRSYTGRIERGLSNPALSTLHTFAKALNVDVREFFKTERNKAKPND